MVAAFIIGSASTVVQASECTAYTSCSSPGGGSAPGSQTAGHSPGAVSCSTTVVCTNPSGPGTGPFEFDTTRITPAPIDPGGSSGGGGGGGGGANANVGGDYDEEVVTVGIADLYPGEWDYERWKLETYDEYNRKINYAKDKRASVKGNGEAAGRERFRCKNNADDFQDRCETEVRFGKQEETETCSSIIDSVTASLSLGLVGVDVSSGSRQNQCVNEVNAATEYRLGTCASYGRSLNNACDRITAD